MTRVKLTIALCAAMLSTAICATSASAIWMAGNRNIPANTTVSFSLTTRTQTATLLSIPPISIHIICTQINMESGSVSGGTLTSQASSITLVSCSVNFPKVATCQLQPQPADISTKPIIITAKPSGSLAARFTLTPKTGKELAVIPFSETNTCALAGEQPLSGAVTLAVPRGQDELLSQELQALGSVENNSLQVGVNKALIEQGSVLINLANDSKWSLL